MPVVQKTVFSFGNFTGFRWKQKSSALQVWKLHLVQDKTSLLEQHSVRLLWISPKPNFCSSAALQLLSSRPGIPAPRSHAASVDFSFDMPNKCRYSRFTEDSSLS
jgi:hypothetical protein